MGTDATDAVLRKSKFSHPKIPVRINSRPKNHSVIPPFAPEYPALEGRV